MMKKTICGLILCAGMLQSCEKDILEGQPEWLGNSIYERLEEGIEVDGKVLHFNTMIRLIDELDQKPVLAKTGSKTLFVASDEAFDEWFRSNDWGVRSYDQLSETQKKTLLNNAMINNAYLLGLMTNVAGNPPQEGLCMRRATASSILDTVYTITPEEMPVNPLFNEALDTWKSYRDRGLTLKLFKDNTSAPMIHFLPQFMIKNNVTDEDLSIITNGRSTSNQDAWINGRKVISSEQICKNGYVYVVDGVIEPSRNMAEIIEDNPNSQIWAKMLKRFSVPVYDYANSREYNRIHNTNDSIYTLRYFSDWTRLVDNSRGAMTQTPAVGNEKTNYVPSRLSFDPGWNQYMWNNPMGYDMHYDAGAMIVPTDEALRTWWNGAGKTLQDEYGDIENIPSETLAELIRVHMLPSFVESVPSKFRSIVDDAKVELGIKPSNVTECTMGCNGVVYFSDQVFPPSVFRSVVYPALSSQSLMGVMYNAIKNYDFGPFLNSMESKFSMILPYSTHASIDPYSKLGNVYLQYIDPATYGLPQQVLFEFYMDEGYVKANRYVVNIDEHGDITWDGSSTNKLPALSCDKDHFDGKGIHTNSSCVIMNRLADLVDNLIIIGTVNANQKYYKTKAGSVIYVDYRGEKDVHFAGGYQLALQQEVVPDTYFDMTKGSNGNGVSYGVLSSPLTSPYSVYELLENHAKADDDCTCEADSAYRVFFELMMGDPTKNSLLASADGNTVCANDQYNKNCRLFENYNYTVYVPTNKSLRKLIADNVLPTWSDYETASLEDAEKAEKIAERIQNFLRYHIQDNSIFVSGTPVSGEKYESSKIDESTRRFYAMTVTADADNLTVIDNMNNTAHIVKTPGLYNNVCREYWMTISGVKGVKANRQLVSSSNAVVHQIDAPLFYDQSQLSNWRY